jgi:hypothetical protein
VPGTGLDAARRRTRPLTHHDGARFLAEVAVDDRRIGTSGRNRFFTDGLPHFSLGRGM